MSSNPDHRDLVAWFQGRRPKGRTYITIRLTYGFVEAINRVPLSYFQRLRAYMILASWVYYFKRSIIGEIFIPLYESGRPARLAFLLKTLIFGKSS